MSWRGKYIGWYRVLEQSLGKLVPNLSDNEVVENVDSEDQFITPTGQEGLPINKQKPLPKISLRLSDTNIEIGILYDNQEQLELLRNIFRDFHTNEREQLLKQLQSLDSNYETLLYRKGRDEKPELLRKYVTARLDIRLIERIIEEMENFRKGGRQIQNNKSVYVTPKTPQLYLTRVSVSLLESALREVLREIKPIYSTVMGIKTQREIISDRLRKPRIKRNIYREFINSLNEARKQDIISAEQRREFNKKWREDKDERENLMEKLKDLLNASEGIK